MVGMIVALLLVSVLLYGTGEELAQANCNVAIWRPVFWLLLIFWLLLFWSIAIIGIASWLI